MGAAIVFHYTLKRILFISQEIDFMSQLPPCPKCNSEYTYADGELLICPECAHEWSASGEAEVASDDAVKKDHVPLVCANKHPRYSTSIEVSPDFVQTLPHRFAERHPDRPAQFGSFNVVSNPLPVVSR